MVANAVEELVKDWRDNPRWEGIERPFSAEDVVRLRGSVKVEYTLAKLGAEKLWKRMQEEPYVCALGAVTGNQAMQQVKAGLKAIYCSGWQVAADANLAGATYPDQSLYPADSVPALVGRINNARRCRSRLRRPSERIRADEGDDRGRRGRSALRRPALIGKEVRSHGRQGARSHLTRRG
jgi:isocitrate lyase